VIAALAVAVAVTGLGRASVDHAIGKNGTEAL
jgi:hypothetical protein